MRMTWPKALSGLVVAGACAALAPAAAASITPSLTLSQSSSNEHAGSTVNLPVDLKFAPSPATDSPKDLTLSLPPGLLANASIDGGACLNTSTPIPACQVGTGTVTAAPILLGIAGPGVSVSVSFDLVTPPSAADLAGLAIVAKNPVTGISAQLGSTGDIKVNSSGAVSIAFHNIPNSYALVTTLAVPIAVDEINSTFQGLRLPTRCPSPGRALRDLGGLLCGSDTQKPASAPLTVTGCSTLPFSPLLSARAAKDSGDNGVTLTTDVTQTAGQATSRSVGLTFPSAVVAPNAAAVISGGLLCTDPSFASCKTIGTSTAKSPLYPKTLGGKVYLTGSLAAPAITVTFPPPFALTLNGKVNLATNTTTFTGVPDLPLSDLRVTLAGGPEAAFATTCATPSGNAVGSFVSQDGDLLASSTAPFSVVGCPACGRRRRIDRRRHGQRLWHRLGHAERRTLRPAQPHLGHDHGPEARPSGNQLQAHQRPGLAQADLADRAPAPRPGLRPPPRPPATCPAGSERAQRQGQVPVTQTRPSHDHAPPAVGDGPGQAEHASAQGDGGTAAQGAPGPRALPEADHDGDDGRSASGDRDARGQAPELSGRPERRAAPSGGQT